MNFQAKEIQRIIEIKKHRYEYIASKIGITPDVEEGEGRGKTHIYSFKNLMQFALAHHAIDMGLPPKAVRKMLLFLHKTIKLKSVSAIFKPKISTKNSHELLYYIKHRGPKQINNYDYYVLGNPKVFTVYPYETRLKKTVGYTVINIGVIKGNILKKLWEKAR